MALREARGITSVPVEPGCERGAVAAEPPGHALVVHDPEQRPIAQRRALRRVARERVVRDRQERRVCEVPSNSDGSGHSRAGMASIWSLGQPSARRRS